MSDIALRENVPLAPFTTMKVGGPARYFVEVRAESEAMEAVRLARENSWKVFVLGGGSNVIFGDDGFPGLVILDKIAGFESELADGKVRVRVGAGEVWDDFVRRAVEADWQGVENLSGVPGSVGSAPVQNVGCYGQSVEETITVVRAIDIPAGEIETFGREDCGFGYRDSIFRAAGYGRYFITQVEFELVPSGKARVSAYPDIEKYFAGRGNTPTLEEMRRAILEIRARKGMVIMPEYESFMSVGSFFKNPVVPAVELERIKRAVDGIGTGEQNKWFWGREDGTVKLAAARLVESAGFVKGYREGNVGISPKHSLAIINVGGANSRDIADFAAKIRLEVRKKFGVELEYEAQFVGI